MTIVGWFPEEPGPLGLRLNGLSCLEAPDFECANPADCEGFTAGWSDLPLSLFQLGTNKAEIVQWSSNTRCAELDSVLLLGFFLSSTMSLHHGRCQVCFLALFFVVVLHEQSVFFSGFYPPFAPLCFHCVFRGTGTNGIQNPVAEPDAFRSSMLQQRRGQRFPQPRRLRIWESRAPGTRTARAGFVESPDGFVCTQLCTDQCPEGYSCKAIENFYPDVVFL